SLPPGTTQVVSQSYTLPLRLPAGLTLSSLGVGKIAVVLDPENAVNEAFKNNNVSTSGPITLRLLGTDGTSFVPNLPAPGQLLPVQAPAVTAKIKKSPVVVTGPRGNQRLYRKPPPRPNSLIHNLSVFPKRVNDLLKKYI